jgi:hypothetical protein
MEIVVVPVAYDSALLSGTGQSRRLVLCGSLATLGFGLASIAPVFYLHDMATLGLVSFTLGALLLLVPVWTALRTIRCPRCGMPWLQFALGERPMGSWIHWLRSFTSCPECSLTIPAQGDSLSHLTTSWSGRDHE